MAFEGSREFGLRLRKRSEAEDREEFSREAEEGERGTEVLILLTR